jgi:formylglycine-generating enzyme required for sulfatase activity
MGSIHQQDPEAAVGEMPSMTVTLDAFSVAAYPVTVMEYAAFVNAGHAAPPELRDPVKSQISWSAQLETLFHPVVMVSWHDAQAYAQWLTDCTGQRWRLPTEAEWEKAARWDERSQKAYVYPWGDRYDPGKVCVQTGSRTSTTSIGTFLGGKSPCGALDMAGNVQEWTNSLYRAYPYLASDGREDLSAPGSRTLRGGSWRSYWQWMRAANRQRRLPNSRADGLGFRLVVGS